MDKKTLIKNGVNPNNIKFETIYIDEISSSPFSSIEDFLFDYSFYPKPNDYGRNDVRYHILSGSNKTIKVLVWLEKE